MSGTSRALLFGAGVLSGVLLATTVQAQGVRPAASVKRTDRGTVNQMEIFNGSNRTVRYFGSNLSPGEDTTLKEMERLENESEYVRDLNLLKQQYVVSERFLEPYRRLVQKNLYGMESTQSVYGGSYVGYGGNSYGAAGYYGYPYVFSGRYGWGGTGGVSTGESASETYSLANGVGDEGRIKAAMAMVLAQQATPEYASTIDKAYSVAVLRASTSPTLQVAFRLPSADDTRRERSRVATAAATVGSASPVTLTLKGGDTIMGKKMREEKDWFIVDTLDGDTVQIRQSEVVRIDRSGGTGTGFKPAIDR